MSVSAGFIWLVKKAADLLVGELLKPTLDKRIRREVERWRASLPPALRDNDLWPAALLMLDDTEGGTNDARRALRASFEEGFPDEQRWLDALLELWRELHATGGVAFAVLSEHEALPHLKVLARRLQRVCAQESAIALPALVAATAGSARRQAVTGAHAEIERAKAAINTGKLDVGWDILEMLHGRQWDVLTPRGLDPVPRTV